MVRAALLALLMLAGLAAPAQAALNLCNRTSYVLYAATAAVDGQVSDARGWTRIAPGECQVARGEPLTARSYLVYARTSLAHSGPSRAWGGTVATCVRDGNFALRRKVGAYCTDDDLFALPFASLDTAGKRNWTMNFDDKPPQPSLMAAQLAGVKRLLADNGFRVGNIDAKPNAQTGAALTTFRKGARLPPQAGNAELFNALEARARGTSAPAGYTVCNDTRQLLLVALGRTEGNKASSHGWWKIEGGACARVITAPLATQAVWLLAQSKEGETVAGGADMFCVAAAAFDINDRSNCAKRGLTEAGFARTDTRGLSGFIARIGEGGLKPPSKDPPRQASMSK